MAKDTKTQVRETHDWISKQMEIIQHVDNELFRRLLLVTIIDSFAQHHSEYRRYNVQEHFSDFICKYGAEKWPFLNHLCCVTLYNYFSDLFLAEKIVLIIPSSSLLTADDSLLKEEANKLARFLIEHEIKEEKIRKHTYANLIYAMRNKNSHELTNPGCPVNFYNHEEKQIPSIATELEEYIDLKENKEKTKKLIPKCWNLHIPEQFLINLLLEVTNNYLNECLNNDIAPFVNNSHDRKFRIAWYDD